MTDGNLQPNPTEQKFPFRSVTLCRLYSVPFRQKGQIGGQTGYLLYNIVYYILWSQRPNTMPPIWTMIDAAIPTKINRALDTAASRSTWQAAHSPANMKYLANFSTKRTEFLWLAHSRRMIRKSSRDSLGDSTIRMWILECQKTMFGHDP
uniref:Uncharacterized protein n=1 Tax=Romanomermis culicivorax TaxID=13658 RepID=A0A915J8E1_ROMCU